MKGLLVGGTIAALMVSRVAFAGDTAPDEPASPSLRWGLGAGAGLGGLTGAPTTVFEGMGVLEVARTPHRYVHLELGVMYASGEEHHSIPLFPLTGFVQEFQERSVTAALLSAFWGWRWSESASVRVGLTSGLARGVVQSPTCGEAVYVGPPLLSGLAFAWEPIPPVELSITGAFGFVPVPTCRDKRDAQDTTVGREFWQNDQGSGMGTFRTIVYF